MKAINKSVAGILLLGLINLLSWDLFAQTRVDAGLSISPAISYFNTSGKADHFRNIFALNYGFCASWKKRKAVFSTGIHHITQGAKFEFLQTTTDNPEGSGAYYDMIIRARTIMVPLNVDYIFKTINKTEVFAGFGLNLGYLYSQQQENTAIPKGEVPDPAIIYHYPQERVTDVDLFDSFYFGLNAGLGVRHFFNDKTSIQFRPNYLFQFRKDLPADQYAFTNRLRSLSLDFTLFYTF
jgi:hypothetical protein